MGQGEPRWRLQALIDELAEMAEREGRPAAEVLQDALAHYAVEGKASSSTVQESRLPSWFGIGTAVADDGYDSTTIKEWIRTSWKSG